MAFFDTFTEYPPTRIGWRLMQRQNRYHLETLREIRPRIQKVAEIGPGVGAFARFCKQESLDYVGIEPNPRICSNLRKAGHNMAAGWVPPLPLADRSQDVVHAAHVIEHNPTFREAMDFLAECRRAVDTGGLVSVLAPDYDHLGHEFFKTHYSHSLPINMRRLTQLMTDGNLTVRHTAFLSGPFHGPLRWLTQSLAWVSTARLIWLMTLGRLPMPQSYSAKMTFMRAVWVVGQRTS